MNIKIIQKLKEETGSGLMDCKKALEESNNNFEKALDILKNNSDVFAIKKSVRKTKEGLIESYIHTGNKLGVMVELNCETDFVSKKYEFKELAKNIAMQIASCPDIEFITFEDIPNEIKNSEKKSELLKSDLINKSEDIINKIITGRVNKILNSKVLLEQEYIKDSNITISQLLNKNITLFGESIKIKRFIRFKLGD
jgi:elongation factor Ts